jgi:shikimate dehydrogenase
MFGLLGKKLSHSFSKEIHEHFTNQKYELIEKDSLEEFFKEKSFKGINVTIPYKAEVIQYLDYISKEAVKIGSVNTIINKNNKLYGYNTDYYGLQKSFELNNIILAEKQVLIIGNGSTSKTVYQFCKDSGAKEIIVAARNPKLSEISIGEINTLHNIEIIINATPLGMYPNNDQSIDIDFNNFNDLLFVMDVVYNPLRTTLLQRAKSKNIKVENGLTMLFYQAIKAIELFHDILVDANEVTLYYQKLYQKLTNFVLIGMPMSGKSFYAKLLSEKYSKRFIDIDKKIEEENNMKIPDIFETHGEQYFRKQEHLITTKYAKELNTCISCGGGVILNDANMQSLKQNGVVIFIDFPLEELKKCNPSGRPLLNNSKSLEKLYNERIELYRKYADITISKTSYNERETMSKIEVKINEYFNTKWT